MKGYGYDDQANFWVREGFSGIVYSDGTETEERIFSIISKASDVSVLSEELETQIVDWPSEYHLSRARHCLIRPLGIEPGDKVLELGCGCGAITRFLGEIGAVVVAVEGTAARARVAAERCRDLNNVRVVCDDLLAFTAEEKFDWVLFVGVLEYAPVFSNASDPVGAYLQCATGFLAQNGRLIVAIENQLGLKYLSGYAEDHLGKSFFGIHDLYDTHTPVTYGKQVLKEKLCGAGLSSIYFFFPYPDYKLPKVVVSEVAFLDENFRVSDVIMQAVSRDYSGSNPYAGFSETLAASVFERNGFLEQVANSFLVVASKSDVNMPARSILGWHYSCYRKAQFCTETIFQKGGDSIFVTKRRILGILLSTQSAMGWSV